MTVWAVMPSAAPLSQAKLCVMAWKSQKYRVAIACEDDRQIGADWVLPQAEYPGYANSVNRLVKAILEFDPECVAVVAFGDDMAPDPKRTANEIATEYVKRFGGTLFALQPTGDRWSLETCKQPQSERVAGSPWLGREFCQRAYMGRGPLWPEYTHCFADQELQEVATKLGVFGQDETVSHAHHHFLRTGGSVPPHAAYAYSKYPDDQAIFERRKAAGFPDSDLLP